LSASRSGLGEADARGVSASRSGLGEADARGVSAPLLGETGAAEASAAGPRLTAAARTTVDDIRKKRMISPVLMSEVLS
jgi:hypothetical protein